MTYIPGINQPIPSSPSYPSVTAGDLTSSEYPMVYTTDGPLPTANGIAFTTTGLVFDPQQVTGGLVTKIIAGANITVSGDGTGEVTISSTGGGGGGAVNSVSVAGNNLTVNSTTGDVVITSTVIPQRYGASSLSMGEGAGSPGAPNGGNVFIGALSGANAGGAGGTNTFVGYKSGENTVGGTNNVFVGAQTLTNITSGANNTLIGANAGASIGSTTSFTTIVGTHQGYVGTTGEVIVGRNGNFLRLNSSGALCFGNEVADQDFGTAGEILTSQGSGSPPVWASIPAASTTAAGIVQLNDSVSSTSTTQALTANQGKALQDQINSLLVSGELILAGTFDASTGTMASVSSNGSTAGFTVGGTLPAPAAGNNNYFVITVVPGSYSPTGGGGPYTMSQGDWLLSDGTTWAYFNVGYDPQPATINNAGVVALSTNSETNAGLESTVAVTPSSLQSKLSDSVSSTSSNTIASSKAVNLVQVAASAAQADASQAISDAAAAQTTATQALGDAATAQATADAAVTNAATAQTTANAAIPKSAFTAGGQLVSSTAAGTTSTVATGLYNAVLRSTGSGTPAWSNVGAANGGLRNNNGPISLDNLTVRWNSVAEMFQFSVQSGTATISYTVSLTPGLTTAGGRVTAYAASAGVWREFTTSANLTNGGETVFASMWYSDANGFKGYTVTAIKGETGSDDNNIINITRIA